MLSKSEIIAFIRDELYLEADDESIVFDKMSKDDLFKLMQAIRSAKHVKAGRCQV